METFKELYPDFDPNAPGQPGSFYGLPQHPDHAHIIILSIPWDATVSYHEGTSSGPEAIREASLQVDLEIRGIRQAWTVGIAGLAISEEIKELGKRARAMAREGSEPAIEEVNRASEKLNQWVHARCKEQLKANKLVIALGGDHSTPLGLIQALSETYDSFGILQIDAHADLRDSYEGFTWSHASIMNNALKLKEVSRLVQVGVRDICEEEIQVISNSNGRISTYYYQDLADSLYQGGSWDQQCSAIVEELPQNVYLSFDIDGLDPVLCPNTGTPVPGGLDFYEAIYLVRKVVQSGRKIIGVDLSEVCPGTTNDWDANVGARVLYHLAAWAGVSWKRLRLNA